MSTRSLYYLKTRFTRAIKEYKGTLKITKSDVDALNNVIELVDSKKVNTNLEDALMLFWIFGYWRMEINEQEIYLKEDKNLPLRITGVAEVLDRLCTRLDFKRDILFNITTDLQTAQLKRGQRPEELISEQEVGEAIGEILKLVKERFRPISDLKKYKKIVDVKGRRLA